MSSHPYSVHVLPGARSSERMPAPRAGGALRIAAACMLALALVWVVAELMPAAQALARQIADKAPIALRYAKESVVGGLGLPLADGIRLENDLSTLLRTTDDRVEGAKAFVEKRKPRWTGR